VGEGVSHFEGLLWVSVVLVVAGELPDNDCPVSGGRENHVRVFGRRCQRRDPTIVSCKTLIRESRGEMGIVHTVERPS
jgi:hypothetical protein